MALIKTEYACLTNTGGRRENEDCVQVLTLGSDLAVIVADGLGGHGNGALASRTAVQELLESFRQGRCRTPEEAAAAIAAANQAVLSCQTEDCRMKTTLASLFLTKEQVFWAHVGDSRVYYFQNAKLRAQTLDHSVSQMAVYMGMISQNEVRFHADRSRILKALGSESSEAETSPMLMLENGFHAFLLCSDGFWEYVLEGEMEETLSRAPNPEQWICEMERILRQRAPKDQDNYTAAAVFAVKENVLWKCIAV